MKGYLSSELTKINVGTLLRMKQAGEKITMLTAYDYTTARILDEAGIDSILIGDSAANVMAGYDTTIPMTLDQMIVYASSVARAVRRALVICDMPFGTYTNPDDGVRNAVRLMQEGRCDALKLEGGAEITPTVRKIIETGIPVMGHLGLTPQSITSSAPTPCAPRRRPRPPSSSATPTPWKPPDASAWCSKRYPPRLPSACRPSCPSPPSASAAEDATVRCSWSTT